MLSVIIYSLFVILIVWFLIPTYAIYCPNAPCTARAMRATPSVSSYIILASLFIIVVIASIGLITFGVLGLVKKEVSRALVNTFTIFSLVEIITIGLSLLWLTILVSEFWYEVAIVVMLVVQIPFLILFSILSTRLVRNKKINIK